MNKDIAVLLYRIADYLELKGEIIFKIRAYRNAASTLEGLTSDIREIMNKGELENLKGIGKAIAKKIEEYIETGHIRYLDDLEDQIHPDLIRMLDIPSLGPKKVMQLHKKLGIWTLDDLKETALNDRIKELDGFGEVSQNNIIKGLETYYQAGGRMLLGEAYGKAMQYIDHLKNNCSDQIRNISIAGSLRRMCETIGDIDILVAPSNGGKSTDYDQDFEDGDRENEIVDSIMEVFTSYTLVKDVIARGKTKSSVRFHDGTQVDLRVIDSGCWGAALQYFTGSQQHNIAVRKIAISIGLKINEYGVYDRKSKEKKAGNDEIGVYEALGLSFPYPETREDRGEIELAQSGQLPELISIQDIKGDLHIHSTESDGHMSWREVVDNAKGRNYEYIGIADHSPNLKMINAPDEIKVMENIERLRELDHDEYGIKIFAGSEVDILKDGSLDYPDHVLEELDYVVGSVHSGFKMSSNEMTKRLTDAMSTGHINILGHPTCRKIGQREPCAMDMNTVMDSAMNNNIALEINSIPVRLDLNMDHVIQAMNKGNLLSINSDGHSPHHLEGIRFGIGTARKGRATPDQVINAWTKERINKFFSK